jgi:hypothetical protein
MKHAPKILGHEFNSKLAFEATTVLLAQASKIRTPLLLCIAILTLQAGEHEEHGD